MPPARLNEMSATCNETELGQHAPYRAMHLGENEKEWQRDGELGERTYMQLLVCISFCLSGMFWSAVAIFGAEYVVDSVRATWETATGIGGHIDGIIFKVARIMVILMMVTCYILGVLE